MNRRIWKAIWRKDWPKALYYRADHADRLEAFCLTL
ncbi:hypothetical protein LCGC14_1216860 [marine sediment metagenome]|uniref:Uncharacterized protein n=1 Tax=marine sediment metagenome TaxID=412755 RepID=A0A0F9LZR9_9ZZZZ